MNSDDSPKHLQMDDCVDPQYSTSLGSHPSEPSHCGGQHHRYALMGAGRVANHMASALHAAGWQCAVVYSRTEAHARPLAERVGALPRWGEGTELTCMLEEVAADTTLDMLLISLTDTALCQVAELLPHRTAMPVLHTSGTTPMSVLRGVGSYGVLYPLQTFSHSRPVELSEVPFYVSSSDARCAHLLEELRRDLHICTMRHTSDSDRARLHVSAVFGCNFVNHLYGIASDLLRSTDIPFGDLAPLLHETLSKALSAASPYDVQTGPAVRGDRATIQRHMELLQGEPTLQGIYRQLSDAIAHTAMRPRGEEDHV